MSQERVKCHSLLIEPDNWFEPLNWADWFPSQQPVEVDLGAGDGGFIVERAKANPQTNFVAVERLLGRARKIDKKARRIGLANLRVLRMENLYSVKCLFLPASVRVFYLLFPDPWPKKKHQRRRLIRGEFLDAVERALVKEGLFFAATDHQDYFDEIFQTFQQRPGWKTRLMNNEEWFSEKTDFEIQFLNEQRPIRRMQAKWSGRPTLS